MHAYLMSEPASVEEKLPIESSSSESDVLFSFLGRLSPTCTHSMAISQSLLLLLPKSDLPAVAKTGGELTLRPLAQKSRFRLKILYIYRATLADQHLFLINICFCLITLSSISSS